MTTIKGFSRIADARSKRDEVTTDGMLAVLESGGYVALGSQMVDSQGNRTRMCFGADGTSAWQHEVTLSDIPAQLVAARPDLRALYRVEADE